MNDFDGFYRAFEDRERGSRELILRRLDNYRPLLETLVARYPGGRALDVGCGRGEWLQLLRTVGFQGHGVDLDDFMLEACRDAQLSVEQGDALAWLAAQPDESLALVSAFHVVEHIPFTMVQQLVAQAHRVLLPGGVLIMETPNPENITVGAHTFYMDPTHERPLPPRLLQFVPEYVGFERTWIWRLQESEHLRPSSPPALANVLMAVSPDYSVIARKAAEDDLSGFDSMMDVARGRDLELACGQYDGQHRELYTGLVDMINALEAALRLTDERMSLVEQQIRYHDQELHKLTHSILWLMALPFRWAGGQWRQLRDQGLRARCRAISVRLRRSARPGSGK